jgi:type I restriction enzyme S subunit
LREGDVLITASAHSGDQIGKKCAFVERLPPANGNVYFVGELLGITSETGIMHAKWPYYWFLSDQGVETVQGAVAGVHLTAGRAQTLSIPIAPFPEQERIINKLGGLLELVNGARTRLAKVAQILKRFRQAVLAAACSEGETLRLNEIVLDLKYGTAQKCIAVPTGNPVLRIPNIGEGSVRLDDLKYAKLPSRELAALRLVPGDILMIRSNGSVALVGKTALVSEKEAGFAYAGYLIRLRLDRNRVLPEYLNLALQTHSVREQIEIPARSTSGVHNINSTEVLRLNINLPDLDAQRAIVRRVEALFKLADAIEKRVEAAAKRADRLTQAILAKAFRGELVPTEAELARREGRDYEPASALLAHIQAERKANESTTSANGRPRERRKAWR